MNGNPTDTQTWKTEGINNCAANLENLKAMIVRYKEQFDHQITMIDTYYNTTQGNAVAKELRRYSEEDLQSYVNYLDAQISTLYNISHETGGMDNF